MNLVRESQSKFLQRLITLYDVYRLESESLNAYDLYSVDFADWKLSFSDRTPLIHVPFKKTKDRPIFELAESLQDTAREQGWCSHECLVLIDFRRRELKSHLASHYFPRFVIIDETDQESVMASQSPTAALQDVILDQVSIGDLCPYQTSGAVAGSRFFGRAAEVNRILRHPDLSFSIMGVRRIGKTSLLKEVARRLDAQGQNPEGIVWLSCETISSQEQFMEEIVHQLNARELPHLQEHFASPWRHQFSYIDFLRRMAKKQGIPITIILDEFDKLPGLSGNAQDNLPKLLRASMDGGYCRYIVAGFQTLMKELANHDSSLYKALNEIELKPFTRKEAKDIILLPMKSLRVRVEDEEELVSRIYADTSGHPRLVQYYCLQLINLMEAGESHTIRPSMLEGICNSDGLRNEIISTFRESLDSKDRLLIYALLHSYPESKELFTFKEIVEALQEQQCPSNLVTIQRSCERLSLAGFLARQGDAYKFAIPIFPKTIRAEGNLATLITITGEEAQP